MSGFRKNEVERVKCRILKRKLIYLYYKTTEEE